MKTFICFLGLGLFYSAAFAADIILTDGSIFKDATIYQQSALHIVIKQSDGNLIIVSKTLLQSELLAEYPLGKDTIRYTPIETQKSRRKANQLKQQEEYQRSLKAQTAGKNENGLGDEESIRRDRLNRATTGAQAMAEKYFKTEYELVTKAKNIGSIKVTLSKPELIEGWNNRWTVRGKCEVQYDGVEVVVHPYYSSKTVDEYTRDNRTNELDYTPYTKTQYSTKAQDFEAIYSAETDDPTFDITLR